MDGGTNLKTWVVVSVLLVCSTAGVSFAEFRVNTYTTNDQLNSSVAMDANGNFVITWQSLGQDGSSYGIYAQMYDSSGNAVGSEFKVNTYTTNNQYNPSVAMDANGNFVIAWQSLMQDGDSYGIYAQMYDSSGSPVGSEFKVNTYTTSDQEGPSVDMNANGDFVIAWQSLGQDGSSYGIYAQMYDSSGNAVGSEFKVNTYTTGDQDSPSVDMDANGNFVIAWQSLGQDGDDYGIYAQMYDSSGSPVGSEFQVNTYTTSHQSSPSVATDANGDFVIAWQSFGQDGSSNGIYAQIYDSSGNTVGSEFRVNTYTTNFQQSSSVAMDANGDFVIAWESRDQDGDLEGIYAQMYDSSGSPVGSEFRVNTYTTSFQYNPSVAMDANGNFVIAWNSYMQDGYNWGIYAQMYDSSGNTVGSELQVNTYTTTDQSSPSVAMNANGNFVIAWQSSGQDGDSYGIYAQMYDGDGNTVGSEFKVNTYTTSLQKFPSVAMDANGDFVIAWESNGQDGSSWGIYAQMYDGDGNTVGSEFKVNTYTTSDQDSPSIAMDANGNFAIAWESYGQDGDEYGIYAQTYDSDGNTVGSEFKVNTYTSNDQRYPSVATDANGDFAIAWQSLGQDGSSYGIYAQMYDNSGSPVGSEFKVNTYTTGEQRYPSVAMDANGDFVIAWESNGQDGSSWGIYAQMYDGSGNPVGSEFQVNTYTTSHQLSSSVAMDANGNFVIAWESEGQVGENYEIYAQMYDGIGRPVPSEFKVNTYTTSLQRFPSVAMDANGDFVIAWQSYVQDGDSWGIFMKIFFAVKDTVVSPNGGESLRSGSIWQITWDTLGTVNDMIIEYSTNNGSDWTEVEPANIGNTGSYNWLVPEVTSFSCLVRVSDPCGQGIVYDTSDDVFAITPVGGSLKGWGRNDDGQADVPDGNDYIGIAGGGYHSLALKKDGSIVGWGDNSFGQTNVPAGNHYVTIAAGEWHSLAIDSNGAVKGWGDNWYGQIDVPDGNDFAAIAAGMYHSLAIKKDGSLVGWGDNALGQTDVPVGNDYVAIAAGVSHSMALKTDGTIVAWGDNSYGQTDVPVTSDFCRISAGRQHSLGLKLNGSPAGCGAYICGSVTVPTERDFTDISSGWDHDLAIKTDGSLAAWGCNDYYQCNVPPGSDYTAVAGGGRHSLAIRTGTGESGSIELYAGWNFVSTPAKLDNSTDEVQQVFADVDTDGYPIYLYDNNTWNQMQNDDLVIVLDGIWIYSTDSNTVVLTFDTNPLIVPPVKALEASWNAIGHSSREAVSANSTLCSVEAQWAYLVGFNAPGQTYKSAIINNDHSGGEHDEDNLMYPSEGYWLYMTSAGELGGLGSGTQAMGQMEPLVSQSQSSTGGPQLPEAYYGTITINGAAAPAGTVITARIDGQVKGTFTTTQEGVYGGPGSFDAKLIVAGDEYDVGQTVTFQVNGVEAEQSDNYDWGTNTNLDLTFFIGATVEISIVLQGGNRPDPAGWDVPVTVGFFTLGADVLVDTAIYEFNLTTSRSGGNALCQVMGVSDGTYDITVVSEHTLLNVKRNVVITSPTTSVNMGTLLEGNANDDEDVDMFDLSDLTASWLQSKGDAAYDAGADFDRSENVNFYDFALMAANWLKSSPIEVP